MLVISLLAPLVRLKAGQIGRILYLAPIKILCAFHRMLFDSHNKYDAWAALTSSQDI